MDLASIDAIAHLAQMAFYAVAGTVAILTYRTARDGLLNTINTEYHKRIIDRLSKLNDDISNVFSIIDAHHWLIDDQRDIFFDSLVEIFNYHKKKIIDERSSEAIKFGLPLMKNQIDLRVISDSYRNDPFIPEKIRNLIIMLAEDRLRYLQIAFNESSNIFIRRLNDPNNWNNIEEYNMVFCNNVNRILYENGVGISQVQERVSAIQKEIQKYFGGFNKLPNTRIGT
jgi:hypothetical protein